MEVIKEWTPEEIRAKKFLEETDTMQFSTMELLVMFSSDELTKLKAENEELRKKLFSNRVGHQATQDLWTKSLKENTQLKEKLTEVEDCLQSIVDYEKDSDGIIGYHQNGEVLMWGEIEEIETAKQLLANK